MQAFIISGEAALSVWNIIGLAAAACLLLLARSAWKQGEWRQFLWSLAIVASIIGVIGAVVFAVVACGG